MAREIQTQLAGLHVAAPPFGRVSIPRAGMLVAASSVPTFMRTLEKGLLFPGDSSSDFRRLYASM